MDRGNFKREEFNYEDNSQLLPLAKSGDKNAMNRMIEMNLPLVSSLSKKFLNLY